MGDGVGVGEGAGAGNGDDEAGGGLETVTIAADESTDPAAFDTRTQNVEVVVSADVVKLVAVAPVTGADVSPDDP